MSDLDLDAIREQFAHYREHQAHAFARQWSCCSAHGPADHVPALLAEVERLTKRVAEEPIPCPVDHGCDVDESCSCWCDLHDCPIDECPTYRLVTSWLDARDAEVERLKASQQPDGGEWVTEYGHNQHLGKPAYFDAHTCASPYCNVQRRVWYGPAEPIVEVSP